MEIIFDAKLAPTNLESFEFFGIRANPLFSYHHIGATLVVCSTELAGDLALSTPNTLEFIAPLTGETMRHVGAVERHGGYVNNGHFYKVEETYINYDQQPVRRGAFKVPSQHYYFRGVKHVQ